MILRGSAVSPGTATGRAHIVRAQGLLRRALEKPAALSPSDERARFDDACQQAIGRLASVQQQLSGRGRSQDAEIFATHAAIIEDRVFVGKIVDLIDRDGFSAEAAVATVVLEIHEQFVRGPQMFLRDKAIDVLDVGRRLVQELNDSLEDQWVTGRIVVCTSVTPSELAHFAHQGAAGILAESCGVRSHAAILARSLGIPLIAHLPGVTSLVPDDAEVSMDGSQGVAVVVPPGESPTEDEIWWRGTMAVHPRAEQPPLPAMTQDGHRITTLLNVSDPVELAALNAVDADGIGLFRTEFLYLARSAWPTAEEIFQVYRDAAHAVGSRELNIRLPDFGAEKVPPYADIPINRNPRLGIRGVRLLLQRPDILEPQLQALKKLASDRPLTVLLPMVDTYDTLRAIIGQICRTYGCSDRHGLPFQLGVMIEVPAAALMVNELSNDVDALSVGLTDLTQYVLAADRDDDAVEPYHDPFQPAVLRLVKQSIDVANRLGKPVTICGELAGQPLLAKACLALGARRFSVSRAQHADVVNQVRDVHVEQMTACASELLTATSADAVRNALMRCSDS